MLRAALACAAVVATASVGFSSAQAAPPRVVALGDSYMAGVGAGDYTVTDDCRRSARSYAADATRRTARPLTDESCPGARIPQVLQQASLVPTDAGTVLVQVGGNDVGFSSIAIACLVPQGGSCLDRIAESRAALPAIGVGLQDIARAARTRAPRATIVFAGYPSLLSGSRACASSAIGSLLDIAEIRAIIELQRQLDATIAAAARAAGARYIDWPRSVDQHSLCSPSPWFVTPLSGDPQDSLHPTAKAYAVMGRSVADLLRR
ncbi:MAG: GDSL-type esterase/lipase family protein [Actinomycetota bacterium]